MSEAVESSRVAHGSVIVGSLLESRSVLSHGHNGVCKRTLKTVLPNGGRNPLTTSPNNDPISSDFDILRHGLCLSLNNLSKLIGLCLKLVNLSTTIALSAKTTVTAVERLPTIACSSSTSHFVLSSF
jgi:hypothetical protein